VAKFTATSLGTNMVGLISFFSAFVFLIYYCSKNYSQGLEKLYSFILVVPLSYIDGLDTITALKIGPIGVTQFGIMLVFAFGFLKYKKIKFNIRNNWPIFVLLILYLVNLIFNVGNPYTIKDASTYFVPLLFLLSFLFFSNSFGYNDFINISIKSLYLHSLLLFLLYSFWILSGGSGRFGVTSMSLYCFSIPIMVQRIIENKTSRKMIRTYKLAIVTQCALLLLSQTRSLIIIVAFEVLFSLLSQKMTVKRAVKVFILLFIFVVSVFIAYSYVLRTGYASAGWAGRMFELTQTGFSTQSNVIRNQLMEYYIPLILSQPLGHGFGVVMPNWIMTNSGLGLSTEITLGVDNLFLTYMYKFGIINFCVLVIIITSSIFTLYKRSKNNIYCEKIVFFSFLFLLIPTAVMTGQALDDITVSCFFQAFIAASMNERRRMREGVLGYGKELSLN